MTLLIYLALLDLLDKLTLGYVGLGVIVWFGHLVWWAGLYGNKEDK